MTYRVDAQCAVAPASATSLVSASPRTSAAITAKRDSSPFASAPPGFTGKAGLPYAARPPRPRQIASGAGAAIPARPPGRTDPRLAAPTNAANPHTADGAPATAEFVVALLEEAGATLLALPHTGPSTRLRQSGLEWVRDAQELFPPERTRLRPAVPSSAAIDRMDRVLAWISRIPQDKFVLRRVVGARSLVSPLTGRYLFTWRRLGTAVGADHKAVQRWHSQGIALIVAALNAR